MVNGKSKTQRKTLKRRRCKYQHLSEEEKNKRRKQARGRYQNVTEEEKEKRHQYYQECKQKLPEYRRNYYLIHKQ